MRIGFVFCAMASLSACGQTDQPSGELGTGITVSGHFGEDGEASEDMSGLACDWQGGGDTLCIAIDDEGDEVRWARFDGGVLVAGETSFLIDGFGEADMPTYDVSSACSDRDGGSREFDGEAAAFDDGTYFVVGSHGCARGGEEYRPASFFVARILHGSDGAGRNRDAVVAQSAHLGAMIALQPELQPYFLQSLNGADGLNIEGLAVRGERMVFGLRAPVFYGSAFLLEAPMEEVFAWEREPDLGAAMVSRVALGPNAGIRDLAFLPDGRLLILSGPAQEQDVPYRIHQRDETGVVTALATVEPPYGGKAEAMAVVGMEGDTVSLIVMFDGVEDGAPRLIEVELP